MNKHIFFAAKIIILAIIYLNIGCSKEEKSVFSKENITPWCIVPFDAKKRNPQERAEMLRNLGFKTLAYDWRDANIPEFDEEIIQLKKHDIKMTAFWWSGGLPATEEKLRESEKFNMQMDFFTRNSLHLDVWMTLSEMDLQNESDEKKYVELARRVDILAKELKKAGCRLGLYNHGGWGGQPHNMVEVMKRVQSDNVGIVYNFHHGHEHLEMMPEAFYEIMPYLYCVNLNGMNKEGPKILTLGQGNEDLKILKMISESGYKGPVGILGHTENEDIEIVLKRNIEGLKKLLLEIGDTQAYQSYL